MTGPRFSGSYPAAHRRVVGGLLLTLGLVAAVLGLAVAGVEFWHSLENRHPIIWQNIAGAALFVGAGAGLIQTGSVRETLGILRAAIPLFQSQQPGGNRRTDPPIDDAAENVVDHERK